MDQIAEEDFDDIVSSYTTPAEKIVKMLMSLKQRFVLEDPIMEKELTYAINKINDRKIYVATHEDSQLSMQLSKKKQTSQIIDWLNEFSEVNQENSSESSVIAAKL